jgi:3-oxoacyl-[acyl-carrier-protein] synthase II
MSGATQPDRAALRVVVTGMGMVSAAGEGVDVAWRHLAEGLSALSPIRTFDPVPYARTVAGEANHVPRDEDGDRGFQLLDLAATELLSSSGWGEDQRGRQTGVVLGTCQGSIERAESIHREYARRPQDPPTEDHRQRFASYRPGAGTSRLAEQLGIAGPRATVGMVCVSSSVALLHAVELIRRGACRRAVAGGFEEFSQFTFTGFHCIGAMASGALKPFDETRDGTVLGEAAVLLTLERLDDARERGATILAEVVGGGFAADAFHMTAPDPDGAGLERAIRQAFGEAGVGPADVDYISAHGTGTAFNDGMESKAFARIFAELADAGRMPPISGIKAVFGHTLGAAGALDALVSILAIRDRTLPATVAHTEPIQDWDFVPGCNRKTDDRLDLVLSTNSAFGGNNSAVLLRRVEEPA